MEFSLAGEESDGMQKFIIFQSTFGFKFYIILSFAILDKHDTPENRKPNSFAILDKHDTPDNRKPNCFPSIST